MDKTISFTSLLSELPNRVSAQMADNLSVPITFVCLLHLANEKVSEMFVVFSAISLLCTNNSLLVSEKCIANSKKTVTVHSEQEREQPRKQGNNTFFCSLQ